MQANITRAEAIKNKIFTAHTLQAQLAIWQLQNKKIVFTNGCFDLLHLGHVTYLAAAAELGDVLIVAVNSDSSVKKQNKGPSRPLQNEQSRATIIASLHVVDAVIIFDDDTPIKLIQSILPHVLVKGGDWKPEQIVGADVIQKNGGTVKSIPFLDGYSTTGIEQKILNSLKNDSGK